MKPTSAGRQIWLLRLGQCAAALSSREADLALIRCQAPRSPVSRTPAATCSGQRADNGGDRADGRPLGQTQVHPGELRHHQVLAPLADSGQQPGPGSPPAGRRDGRSASVGRPPAPAHGKPRRRSRTSPRSRRLPAPRPTKTGPRAGPTPVILFNTHDGHPPPACHLESVREAQCHPSTASATVR